MKDYPIINWKILNTLNILAGWGEHMKYIFIMCLILLFIIGCRGNPLMEFCESDSDCKNTCDGNSVVIHECDTYDEECIPKEYNSCGNQDYCNGDILELHKCVDGACVSYESVDCSNTDRSCITNANGAECGTESTAIGGIV